MCEVRVKNIAQAVELCEVRAPTELPVFRDLGARYASALKYFECQSFDQATSELERVLMDHPDDGPSRVLMARVLEAIESIDAHFDAVWTLSGK